MSEGAHRRLGAVAELLQGAVRDILQEFEHDPIHPHHLLEDEVRTYELREALLPAEMQSMIAWRIVLELYQARMEERRCLVKHVCLASTAPATTVIRHLDILVKAGWIIRGSSEADGRYTVLDLSIRAREKVEAWLERRAADLNSLIKSKDITKPGNETTKDEGRRSTDNENADAIR